MSIAPASGLLDVPAVARSLATNELTIYRLIARGMLKAHQVGRDGPVRITASDLQTYVESGAVDFDPPKIAGHWFNDNADRVLAERFAQAVRDAVAGDVSDKAVAKIIADRGGEDVEFAIPIDTPAMRGLIDSGVPQPMVLPGEAKDTRRWVHVFMAQRLRDGAREAIDKHMSMATPVARLYASPADYAAFVAAAKINALRGAISFSKRYDNSRQPGHSTIARFSLEISNLTNPETLDILADSTF